MKQALELIEKIRAEYKALRTSSSPYLKRDIEKSIKKNKRDLKEYCFYKGLNYKQLIEKYNI